MRLRNSGETRPEFPPAWLPVRGMLGAEYAMRAFIALFAWCIPLAHTEPQPGDAEVQAMLASMRKAALTFDSKLPDFICSQITRREMGVGGSQAAFRAQERERPANAASLGSASPG